jgi:hypothetical protein
VEGKREVLFLLVGPTGDQLKVLAHGVNLLEEFCGEPACSLKRWDMQLGKKDVGIMKQLRTAWLLTDE